jgi:hypothetical protein
VISAGRLKPLGDRWLSISKEFFRPVYPNPQASGMRPHPPYGASMMHPVDGQVIQFQDDDCVCGRQTQTLEVFGRLPWIRSSLPRLAMFAWRAASVTPSSGISHFSDSTKLSEPIRSAAWGW